MVTPVRLLQINMKLNTKPLSEITAILQKYSLLVDTVDTGDFDTLYPETNHQKLQKTDKRIFNPFVCIQGTLKDGHDFAEEAVDRGANLLICEKRLKQINVPQIIVRNSRKSLAVIAKLFYNNPSANFFLIGVTGTNGKTSIVKIIENILNNAGVLTASIGTLGYTIKDKEYPLERTTPDITDLNEIFAEFVSQKVQCVVMEVSSHSLQLDRVYGLEFKLALFTNLSRDHLDFHKNMYEYFAGKSLLFDYIEANNGIAIINTEDYYGKKLFERIKCRKYSLQSQNNEADVSYTIGDSNSNYSNFSLTSTKIKSLDKLAVKTKLFGRHNIFNLSAGIIAAYFTSMENNFHLPLQDISNLLPESINGRLEKVDNKYHIACYVDYAHTPSALENVCKAIKQTIPKENLSKSRLICVFGAGGDRDKGKRNQMTEAVLKHADLAIITTDNPRSENPVAIVLDMVKDIDIQAPYWIIMERKKAIETAVNLASINDILLIAGKGHETYQITKNVKEEFDDRIVAAQAFNQKEVFGDESQSSTSISLSIPISLLQLKLSLGCEDIDLDDTSHLFRKISSDTRTISENSLFFAFNGENFNAHDFINSVLEIPGTFGIVNKDEVFEIDEEKKSRLIRVKDTIKAYAALAKKYKSLFKLKTLCITGSVGKTTTKDILFNILSEEYRIIKNIANENNILGVSKTIFYLKPAHEILLLELGSNHFGEIAELTDISQPDIGIITNIGPAHLEFFGDLNGVFREKSSLFAHHLQKRFAVSQECWNNYSDYKLTLVGENKCRDLDFSYQVFKDGKLIINRLESQYQFSLSNTVPSFLINASIAISVAIDIGVEERNIQRGLERKLTVANRMEIYNSNNRVIISDCYNANPTSYLAAIDYWLSCFPSKQHIAILGDMLELGEHTTKYHLEINSYLQQNFKDNVLIVTVGSYSAAIKGDYHFSDTDSLINSDVINKISEDAIVLLKGSRSIKLEKLRGIL